MLGQKESLGDQPAIEHPQEDTDHLHPERVSGSAAGTNLKQTMIARDIRMWITLIGVRLVNPAVHSVAYSHFETSLESCIYLRLDSHTLQLQDSGGRCPARKAGWASGLRRPSRK